MMWNLERINRKRSYWYLRQVGKGVEKWSVCEGSKCGGVQDVTEKYIPSHTVATLPLAVNILLNLDL